ncbi:tryptophan-rich sensory protein [Candidatus Gracilibacteria bacterium]|nr:tryptophan-rich sensory protein [Candidatus Gracilibacteria bacterium]MCF7819071.1 tryptophan-rich sensory protein [Candidatus Gracilibacteria bacterium]
METNFLWYQTLEKPFFAPPAWIFGPVWTGLYILIFISFGFVFWKAFQKEIPAKIALPFVLNLIFNFLFTPIQFGLQNLLLASLDVILVLITIIWAMKVIWPYSRWVTYVQIPYLVWVSFATVLQIAITVVNWGGK